MLFGGPRRRQLKLHYKSPAHLPFRCGISPKSEGIEKAASLVCHLYRCAVPNPISNSEDVFSECPGLMMPFDSNGDTYDPIIGAVRVALPRARKATHFLAEFSD
jgi:hypothetical protein